MLQTLAYSFIALFVILDPVGTTALFAAFTRGMDERQKRAIALRAVRIAGATLLLFAFAGDLLLKALGIGIPALRIAGGILLFLIAIDMLFARQLGIRNLTPGENAEAGQAEDISVFPLAIPLIAGPGGMTTMVLLMGRAGGSLPEQIGLVAVLLAVLAITLGLLLASARVVQALGVTGINVVSRVLGILLAALAAQLVLDGLHQAFGLA
jgi:multiple antibiotic resistance protein